MYRSKQTYRLNELTDEQIEALMDSCPTDSEPDDNCEEDNDDDDTEEAQTAPLSWSFLDDVLNEEIIINDNLENISYNILDSSQNISDRNIDAEISTEVSEHFIIYIGKHFNHSLGNTLPGNHSSEKGWYIILQ